MYKQQSRTMMIFMFLVLAFGMQVLPFGLDMPELSSDTLPYFSLAPCSVGNIFPLAAGILNALAAVPAFLWKRPHMKKVFYILVAASVVCSLLSWLIFRTFTGGSVVIIVFQLLAALCGIAPGLYDKE